MALETCAPSSKLAGLTAFPVRPPQGPRWVQLLVAAVVALAVASVLGHAAQAATVSAEVVNRVRGVDPPSSQLDGTRLRVLREEPGSEARVVGPSTTRRLPWIADLPAFCLARGCRLDAISWLQRLTERIERTRKLLSRPGSIPRSRLHRRSLEALEAVALSDG